MEKPEVTLVTQKQVRLSCCAVSLPLVAGFVVGGGEKSLLWVSHSNYDKPEYTQHLTLDDVVALRNLLNDFIVDRGIQNAVG